MSIESILADVGEFFVGTKNVKLAGTLTRQESGQWSLTPNEPVDLFKAPVDTIIVDPRGWDISQYDGHEVSLRGRVLEAPSGGHEVVVEPTKVTSLGIRARATAAT